MDRVESIAAGVEAVSATWNGIQDQAASLYQVSWSWRGRRPRLTCDGGNVIVGAHQGCAMGTSQATALFVADNTAATIVLSGLTSDAWYYVYAYDDAGACIYETVTSAPDASLSYKSSDKTRAYVGCFYALSATTARPFRMYDGRYAYGAENPASIIALAGGTAGSFTDVVLTALLPPHARLAQLYAIVTAGGATDNALIRPNGSSNTGLPLYPSACAVPMATDSGQIVEYQKNSATTLSLYVLGFDE